MERVKTGYKVKKTEIVVIAFRGKKVRSKRRKKEKKEIKNHTKFSKSFGNQVFNDTWLVVITSITRITIGKNS